MAMVAVFNNTCTAVKFSIPSNATLPELDFHPAGLEDTIHVRPMVAFGKTCNTFLVLSTCRAALPGGGLA
jgi:hypothetical protein